MSDAGFAPPPPPPVSAPSPDVRPVANWTPTLAISYGWRAIWSRFEIVGVVFLSMLPGLALDLVAGIASASRAGGLAVAVHVVSFFVGVYFTMALTRYCIKVARGDATGVHELFAGGPYWTYLISAVLRIVCILVGLLFLIVPGIIVALGWCLSDQLIVDRGAGPVEALATSWKLTSGWKGDLFLLVLLGLAVVIAGLLACFVGVFIAIPIVQMASAFTYLSLSRQTPVPFDRRSPLPERAA